MAPQKSIRISQRDLEEAVNEGFSQIRKSFADDVVARSSDSNAIREAFAVFIGTYRAVKKLLRDEGIAAGIGYLDREALLDSYSANIASGEALDTLLAKDIKKTKDTRSLFRNSLDFRKYEKDASLREKLIIGELMTRYIEAAGSMNERMISELTVNYFEWVMGQTAKIRDSISRSFDDAAKNTPVIMPSKKVYSGFVCRDVRAESPKAAAKTNSIMHGTSHPQTQRTEYPFLVRNLPKVTFSDVGGLDRQKEAIYDAIKLPIECREEFREKGVEAPKGLIFYGPGGTGKTFIAKALANELNLPFFYVSGPEFRKKYLGEGPKMVRQLFADARILAPSIIFIDEVDACLRQRDSDDGRYSMDIVNQMLAEIDGFNPLDYVKAIVATNYYSMLDSTFCSRFPLNCHIEFSLPDRKERLKALYAMTKKMKTGKIDLESVAEITDSANFRSLYFICNQAGIYSIKEHSHLIEQRHFDMSLALYLGNPGKYGSRKGGRENGD